MAKPTNKFILIGLILAAALGAVCFFFAGFLLGTSQKNTDMVANILKQKDDDDDDSVPFREKKDLWKKNYDKNTAGNDISKRRQYTVEIGGFTSKKRLNKIMQYLQIFSYDPKTYRDLKDPDNMNIRLGAFDTPGEARIMASSLRSIGIKNAQVIRLRNEK